MTDDSWDAIVIGGGFYGCQIALDLRRHGLRRVALLEKETRLLQRASYHNQARVHNGYHYPRSLLTALRSRRNFGRFVSEYEDAICSSFQSVYGVASRYSNVSARQFTEFTKRIGAPLNPVNKAIRKLFNPHLIEDIFLTTEYAFDAVALRRLIEKRLTEQDVEVRLAVEVARVREGSPGMIEVELVHPGTGDISRVLRARHIFNCTYSRLNHVLQSSRLPLVALKHELTELALIEPPSELKKMAITIMCGPFFSCMPFPPAGLHSLSHVRYTPHASWHDLPSQNPESPERCLQRPRHSKAVHMLQDAHRFLPCLQDARYVRSLWEVKTVLPQSEADDSRPIFFRSHHGLNGLHCVLGSKIDNVFDMRDEIYNALNL